MNETVIRFKKLRSLILKDNPWHCDCSLYHSLNNLMRFETEFESEFNAR